MTDPSAGPLLSVAGLTVSHGGHRIVDSLSLDVNPGELVGLIGANGAGKTTVFDAICGFVDHGGSVRFDGAEIGGWPPHRRARAGIGRTWQDVELFDDLTVEQNCRVAARPGGLRQTATDLFGLHRHHGDDEAVATALAAVGLADEANVRPSALSLGHRKLAGVARALAGAPKLLLLDEPAAGLDQSESLEFGRALRRLIVGGDGSLSGLLIDHDTQLIFDVCDRVYVLDFGVLVAEGTVDEIRRDPRVIAAYLGVGP